MTKSNNANQLLNLCNTYNYNNIVLLGEELLSLENLKQLGECEHFDIVLAFDITCYSQEKWKEIIDTLLQLGDHIIIETPFKGSLDYKKKVKEYFIHNKGRIIMQAKNDLFLFTVNRTTLSRTYWGKFKLAWPGKYVIKSTFEEKELIKKRTLSESIITTWHPGINLLTFKKLRGIYPSKKCILELLQPLQYIQHNDLNIHNIVIQGKQLKPIDCGKTSSPKDPQQTIQAIFNYFKS